jgi:glycerophosphoryl diester phosphodiesterase
MAESWPLPDDHQPGDAGFTASINQIAKNLNGVNDRTVAAADVQAAKDTAVAAQEAAQSAAQQAHDISGIDTSDGVVTALVADDGSRTTAQLKTAVAAYISDPDPDPDTNPVPGVLSTTIEATAARRGIVLSDLTPPYVVFHRGAGKNAAPEETFASFDLALAQGARAINTSVAMLADGALAVMHDATVDRTTDGSGDVADFTSIGWSMLTVDASTWYKGGWPNQGRPLYLSDVLNRYGGRVLLGLQPKDESDQTTQAIIDECERRGLRNSVYIPSFALSNVALAISQGYDALLTLTNGTEATVADLKATGCRRVDIYLTSVVPTVTADAAPWLADTDLTVGVWGVERHKDALPALANGADYVVSDWPLYVRGAVDGSYAYRMSYAPWTLDGLRSNGLIDWMTMQSEITDTHLNVVGDVGAYRIQPDANHKSAVLMGWACPLPDPTTYTLTVPFVFDTLDSNSAAAAKVLFGRPDDSVAGYNNDNVSSAGWRARLNQAGTLQLESSTDGSIYTSEASKSTAAITAGQTVTLTIAVTPTTVTLTRTDTGDSITTTNHPEIRGPYWHLRNDCPGAGVYSWGAVTVS